VGSLEHLLDVQNSEGSTGSVVHVIERVYHNHRICLLAWQGKKALSIKTSSLGVKIITVVI